MMATSVNLSRRWLLMIAAGGVGVIFLLDVLTPRGIAVPMLYPLVVLLSLWSNDRRDSLTLGALSLILTVAGYLVSVHHMSHWSLINRGLSLFAICVTALLAYRRKRKEHALQHSISVLEDIVLRLIKARRRSHPDDLAHPRKAKRWVGFWRR
jgi:hypothetical protein